MLRRESSLVQSLNTSVDLGSVLMEVSLKHGGGRTIPAPKADPYPPTRVE